MARPKKKLDEEQVYELASIQCTMIEIAAVMKCSVDTLERRFADTIKRGKEEGKMSIRRAQYKCAMSGNCSMLIWLGKQLLGQKETISEAVSPEILTTHAVLLNQVAEIQKKGLYSVPEIPKEQNI